MLLNISFINLIIVGPCPTIYFLYFLLIYYNELWGFGAKAPKTRSVMEDRQLLNTFPASARHDRDATRK